ncbi:MAG TPA: hypothetical protein VF941_02970 [Clostridia bacterium]
MKITAAPGIYLIKRIEENNPINVGASKNRNILFGEIIAVGENRTHDQGGKLEATYKVGDKIWFLSILDGADVFRYERKDYYTVLFNDARAKLDEN